MTDERKRATPAEARAVTLANGVEVRVVGHAEARQIAQRLINSHFRQEPGARIGIPARPDYDDDLLICAYIEQQAALAAQRAKAPAGERTRTHASGRIVTTPEQRAVIADAWDAVRRGGDVDDRDRMEAALRAANLLEDRNGR